MKNYYRIKMYKEFKTDYCDIIAIQAAENNGNKALLPIGEFHKVLSKNVKEFSLSDKVEIILNEEDSAILVDVKGVDGKFNTGLFIQEIQTDTL